MAKFKEGEGVYVKLHTLSVHSKYFNAHTGRRGTVNYIYNERAPDGQILYRIVYPDLPSSYLAAENELI